VFVSIRFEVRLVGNKPGVLADKPGPLPSQPEEIVRRVAMGDDLAAECLAAMEADPENRCGVLTSFLNRAREAERACAATTIDDLRRAIEGWRDAVCSQRTRPPQSALDEGRTIDVDAIRADVAQMRASLEPWSPYEAKRALVLAERLLEAFVADMEAKAVAEHAEP